MNGQKLEVAGLSSPVFTMLRGMIHTENIIIILISVTRAASALPSPQQVQLCWLRSSRPTPHIHLAFGQSGGDGALQIPLNPSSSSPARAATLGKALYPWRDCHGPRRVKQQLPSPAAGQQSSCLHITLLAPLGCPGASSEPRVSRISPRNVKGQCRK